MKSSAVDSTLILVTKFPTKGVSKTRLYPAIGEDNAFLLAKAMLNDLLSTFSYIPARKILYVPHKSQLEATEFCKEVHSLRGRWSIEPMPIGDEPDSLTSSDLGSLLSHALRLQLYGS